MSFVGVVRSPSGALRVVEGRTQREAEKLIESVNGDYGASGLQSAVVELDDAVEGPSDEEQVGCLSAGCGRRRVRGGRLCLGCLETL